MLCQPCSSEMLDMTLWLLLSRGEQLPIVPNVTPVVSNKQIAKQLLLLFFFVCNFHRILCKVSPLAFSF